MRFTQLLTKRIGPGFVTGASDDDPSGIATYAQTGAAFGYGLIWTALFSLPLMITIQEMCGRIGIVTGKGLAIVIKHHYSKRILGGAILLLLIANTLNIAADLAAMAETVQLLLPLPYVSILIVLTLITILLQILIPYRTYAKFLKICAATLLTYILTALIVTTEWTTVVRSIALPTIQWDRSFLLNIVAILGTSLSPYLFFWQTSEEVEEEVSHGKLKAMDRGRPRFNRSDIRSMRLDTVGGMAFSNLVMLCIIMTTAATLFPAGVHGINSATDAASALRPLAGDSAGFLFAMGILGTGLLAIPVLAGSAAYALAELFGLKAGLYRSFRQAKGFYLIIASVTCLASLLALLPIAPFHLLYYAAVANGLIAPPLLFLIVRLSSNPKVMGKYTNTLLATVIGWITIAVMSLAACALLLSIVF